MRELGESGEGQRAAAEGWRRVNVIRTMAWILLPNSSSSTLLLQLPVCLKRAREVAPSNGGQYGSSNRRGAYEALSDLPLCLLLEPFTLGACRAAAQSSSAFVRKRCAEPTLQAVDRLPSLVSLQ